ncbi:hypothetical protein F0562_012715 [Nyssa sinensis]|uniref:Uncharacterized protein n=1 Tax=Nyssa sinensis TaxID=561372 RepID=A0A5J4ZY45_9ASTE|nr:hypothetical protein F0562_012715 [Nyssa sinensis]
MRSSSKEFEMLNMKVGESVNEYFARTFAVGNKLRANKGTLDNVAVIEKILRSMTPKLLLESLQGKEDEVVVEFEDEEEEEADVALTNPLLNAITVISLDTFNMIVQRRRQKPGQTMWKDAAAENRDEAKTNEHSSTEESETDGSNRSNEGNSSSSGEDLSLESCEQRSRRKPNWMGDYVSGEGLSEEEDMTYLAMFATNDPILFEEALNDPIDEFT